MLEGRARRASGESPGGTFDVPEETTIDRDAALDALGGDEFIFDVQTHYVNYDLARGARRVDVACSRSPAARTGKAAGSPKACFTADAYFREVFVRSDTSMSILSALPTPARSRPRLRRHGLRHRRRDAASAATAAC